MSNSNESVEIHAIERKYDETRFHSRKDQLFLRRARGNISLIENKILYLSLSRRKKKWYVCGLKMLGARRLNNLVNSFSRQLASARVSALIIITNVLNNRAPWRAIEIVTAMPGMPRSSSSAIRFQITIDRLAILRFAAKFNWPCCGNLGVANSRPTVPWKREYGWLLAILTSTDVLTCQYDYKPILNLLRYFTLSLSLSLSLSLPLSLSFQFFCPSHCVTDVTNLKVISR